jgi:hypothetical protein
MLAWIQVDRFDRLGIRVVEAPHLRRESEQIVTCLGAPKTRSDPP